MNKKTLLVALLVLATAGGIAILWRQKPITPLARQQQNYLHKISVGQQILNVDIAATEAEQVQGLSDRKSMQDNQGMLFDFGAGSASEPEFWMKDMYFNLDFVWIKNGAVVDITQNVPAPKNFSDPLPLYAPASPVDSVLEVNAGWAEKNNIKIGDLVKIIS